ncbi:MAG: hypothetical protein ABWX63_08915 [Paeniglutamicibacter terrestris]
MTNPQKDWTLGGIGGAAENGLVSGVIGSQAGYLAGPAPGYFSKGIQYAVGGGGSVAGGSVDNLISGQSYDPLEMAFDGLGGVATSHFQGASALDTNPGWMTHSFAAYSGAHVGAIVESVKFVAGETGVAPW